MSKNDIEASQKKWEDGFNGGDASAVANVYAPNARLLPPNADIVEGRSDIEGFIKGFVATGAQLKLTTFAVHESPELCVAVGRYEMDIPTPDGPQKDNGKYVEAWAKQSDGAWLIIEDIFNSSVPLPEG